MIDPQCVTQRTDLQHRMELPRGPQTRERMMDRLIIQQIRSLSAQAIDELKALGGNCLTDYITLTCDLASKALDRSRHLIYLATMARSGKTSFKHIWYPT
jgi:hypothetical protein